jgi:hypothetical protein
VEVRPGAFRLWVVAVKLELVEFGLLFWTQKLVDYSLITGCRKLLELGSTRPESGAAHQMGHQIDTVSAGHS